MRCPNCGYDNPGGRRYCEECGEKITSAEQLREAARRKTAREAARLRLEAERKGVGAEILERRRRARRKTAKPWMGILLLALVVAGIVIGVIFTASGGESGPEKAVREFYESVTKRDVMGFLKLTDPEFYKLVKSGEIPVPPPEEQFGYERYELRDLKLKLVEETGEIAQVEVVGGWFIGYYYGGGDTGGVDFSANPRTVNLVKNEGEWVIANYSLVMLPYQLPEINVELPEYPEVEGNP
jgi:hypothetical protein